MSLDLQNLIKQDSEFTESKFRSKVENEFIQIISAIMVGKIERIHHFVNEEVYIKIKNRVIENLNNNRIEFFDEPNVATIELLQLEELEDKFNLNIKILFKSYNYYVDKITRKFISGDKPGQDRSQIYYNLTFTKKKNAKHLGAARKCHSCGGNLYLNMNGKCRYCGNIFNLEDYDWVITKMDI